MKSQLLAIALLLLGAAVLTAAIWPSHAGVEWFRHATALGVTIAVVLLLMGGLVLLTALSPRGRSAAILRLDHFMPFLRKKKKAETLQPPALFVRVAQKLLPGWLFADRLTGKPGLVRRSLKWLGPSVLSAPFRRVSQAICFVLFLWLFFYVCWPYGSRPAPAGRVSPGWKVSDISEKLGYIVVSRDFADEESFASLPMIYLVDEEAADAVRGELAPMRVYPAELAKDLRRGQKPPGSAFETVLWPLEPLGEDQIDLLLTGGGTWALYEKSPWQSHYTDDLAAREKLPAELFLVIDPLVSLSTAIAARSWVWSLACAAIILIVCVLIPRGFCGYLCPLGTLIDLFDWAIAGRVKRFNVPDDGWWVHIKYYVLMATLVAAACGVLVSGYVAAIPVITRGMLFLGDPLQSGLLRGWEHLPPLNAGHFVSIALFFAVLGLGILKPRFWCKYVCPSGAVFSLGNLFRVSERKVEQTCINCNKCVEICPFDAIKPDFTTRVTDCTLCQTCAGVCPTQAIKFVERWNLVELKDYNDPPTHETKLGRRGFVSLAAGTAAAIAGGLGISAATNAFGARLDDPRTKLPVRPPGSVPEQEFLQLCIRCGECFKACPYNVLQPMGFEQGLEGLWTPQVVADFAGCAPSCNACGQVCPTGAIRALPLAEKKVARMGLAIVNEKTCLPFAGREACQACVDECAKAGYHAIEFTQVHTQVDEEGQPIEGTGFVAPVVLAEKCVGCGLCQMECYRLNVHQKELLDFSAIIIEAGAGKEDRLMHGSYRELREAEARERAAKQREHSGSQEYYVPDTPPPTVVEPDDSEPVDDPFGIGPEEDASDSPF
jgi:ferredoxin